MALDDGLIDLSPRQRRWQLSWRPASQRVAHCTRIGRRGLWHGRGRDASSGLFRSSSISRTACAISSGMAPRQVSNRRPQACGRSWTSHSGLSLPPSSGRWRPICF